MYDVICSVQFFTMQNRFKILDFCNLFFLFDLHNPIPLSITGHQSVPIDNILVKTLDQSGVKLWCAYRANGICYSMERHNSNIKIIEEELKYIIENRADKVI